MLMSMKGAMFMVLVGVGCKYIYNFLAMHNVGVHFNSHYPGQCRQVPGIQCGSENIAVTKDGLAFVTNGFKVLTNCNPAYTPGRIYLFDFNHPDNNVVALEIDSSSLEALTFDPHGMDIIEDGESIKLFVVNHGNGNETVEKFIFNRREPTTLKHVETIRDEKFVCLNDIALIDENEFYITNYKKTCRYPELIGAIEFYFQLHTSDVVYYKNGNTTVVANGPGFNGVTLSKDKKKLLTAGSSSLYMYVYDIIPGALKLNQMVLIGHFPDNVYADHSPDSGNVFFLGVFKQVHRLVNLAKNKTGALSSSAVKVTLSDDWSKVDVEEVLHDNGVDLVRGVSMAVHYKGQYLFGTVFEKLAYCKGN